MDIESVFKWGRRGRVGDRGAAQPSGALQKTDGVPWGRRCGFPREAEGTVMPMASLGTQIANRCVPLCAQGVALFALLVAVPITGCGRATTQDEVSRMVDQRLAERGLAPAASASATPAASSAAPTDAAAGSLAFLDQLETLMSGYKPEPPATHDTGDALRCVTTEAFEVDAKLREARSKLARRLDEAAKARADQERAFWTSVYPVAFRIDYDWQTRKTAEVPPVSGCFNTVVPNQGGYGPGGNGFFPGWAPRLKTQEECEGYGGGDFHWRVKVPGRPSVFLYSGTNDPPTAPPELMRRMTAAGTVTPRRFSCRVADAVPAPGRTTIKCEPREGGPQLRMAGESKRVNVGDLVSVPLADVKRDPDGVLLRVPVTQRASTPRSTRSSEDAGGPKGRFVWMIDADWSSATVEQPVSCPSIDEVLSSIGGSKP